MERKLAEDVVASIPGGAAVFPYYKDRYGLQLLAYAAGEGKGLREQRRGRFRALLQKPTVRRTLADRGGRIVDWDLLDSHFPSGTEPYVLTFGLWGDRSPDGWYQTSRPGYNVVVRLNFPERHVRAYRRYVEPGDDHPFESCGHPIEPRRGHTLAWARVDLDLEAGEALIEEIQSDWIRDAEFHGQEALRRLQRGRLDVHWRLEDAGCDARQLHAYVEHVLRPHRRMWDEAMLAASLWLVRERLSIRRIFMHTHAGGSVLKQIGGSGPPRSIYETLPRRFCFERTTAPPRFLAGTVARRNATPAFWRLAV